MLHFILGRLPDSARMYGEVFVNGATSHMPYGSYVSSSFLAAIFNIFSLLVNHMISTNCISLKIRDCCFSRLSLYQIWDLELKVAII